jgi:predicted nucleotidyltransferase
MNQISESRLAFARANIKKFKNKSTVGAIVTGSVAKGYADDNSDVDTLIFYKRPYSSDEFERILSEAKKTGGGLQHRARNRGFAVYYYINGIKCDFGFSDFKKVIKLIDGMKKEPEADRWKHLQISGFIESEVLFGSKLINKLKDKAGHFPKGLDEIMVKSHIGFEPEWVMEKMAVERGDKLYQYEYFITAIDNIIWILCGLNKMYHPGKLKGIEYRIHKMKIKPDRLIERYNEVFKSGNVDSVKQLYHLIRETISLVEKHLPGISTSRSSEVLEMRLRK